MIRKKHYLAMTSFFWFLFIASCLSKEDYQRQAIKYHNNLRALHQTPPLKMQDELNEMAVKCAEYLAERRNLEHFCPSRNGLGYNAYAQTGGYHTSIDVANGAAKSWFNEESHYDYTNPGYSNKTEHFTTMIWKSSTRFGFGVARNGDFSVGVGLYYPYPNVDGQYKQNVLRSMRHDKNDLDV